MSLIVTFSMLTSTTSAQAKKAPHELGSILDPDENTTAKKPSKTLAKDPFAHIDKDLPSLPQTLRWELLLTQKAYGITQNLRTASDLITSLSKAIESLCFMDLQRSLYYDPKNRSKECTIVEKHLTDLDAKNPFLPCLNFGIESSECREGYHNQITLETLPREGLKQYIQKTGDKKTSSYSFQSDLEVQLDTEKNAASLRDMLSELSSLKEQTGGTKEVIQAQKKKITDLSRLSLSSACTKYRIVVFPQILAITNRDLPRQQSTPSSKKNSQKGSLEDLLQKGPFSQSIARSESNSSKNHFRLVNKLCLEALSSVEALNPNYSGISCYRDGFTSPTCLDARRAPRANSENSGNTSLSEGIERF